MRARRLLAILVAILGSIACGSDTADDLSDPSGTSGAGGVSGAAGVSGSSGQAGSAPMCVPGASVACAGPGACAGGQVCKDDGSGFGPCDCGGAGAGGSDAGAGGSGAGEGGSAGSAGAEAGGAAGDAGGMSGAAGASGATCLPADEVCDGLDNDCDGLLDESTDEVCQTACGQGMRKCVAGALAPCSAPKPQPEACDGKDNNCNGVIDEGCGQACEHDVCVSAGPLDAACSACAAKICATDKFKSCCEKSWSPECISAVALVCGQAKCSFQCTHPLCVEGDPLKANCDKTSTAAESCVAKICQERPDCCSKGWTKKCTESVAEICGLSCAP